MAFTRTYKFRGKKRDRLNMILIWAFVALIFIYLIYSIFFLLRRKSLFWQGTFSYNRRVFFILGLISIFSSSFLLYKMKLLEKIAKIVLRKEIFDIKLDDVSAIAYGLSDKDLEEGLVFGKFENYKGIEYINRIFFDRFNNKFKKPIKHRLIVMVILVIGANLLISRLNFSDKESLDFFNYGFSLIGSLAGFLIYIGDRFTRTCFYNMDRFLTKNNFYRSPELLKEAIKIRFKKMVEYNLPVLLVLIIGLLGILFQVGASWFAYILTLVFSLLGMVFFNFHYLYAYYLLQPFTVDMQMKNPLYSIFNIFSYYISIMLMTLVEKYRGTAIFAILILVSVYIILGFVLVSKFSYKRFKLR